MKLSIICLNYSTNGYNTAPNYDICLQKIFASTTTVPFEVIMVDNGSPRQDQILWLHKRWGDRVKFVELPRNLGYHGGNEAGFKVAQGEYFMTINPDGEVEPDTIQKLVDFMDAHEEVGIVGPQLIYPDGTIQDSYRHYMNLTDLGIKRVKFLHKISYFKKRMHHYLMWDVNPHETFDVDWLVGNCMLIRRKAYDSIGGFDHRYFLFMGDTDICRTMWKHGWNVMYYPEAKAKHQKSRLSGSNLKDALFKKTFWIHNADYAKYVLKWGLSSKREVKKGPRS